MSEADRVAYWKRRAHRAEQELEFERRAYASQQRWAEAAFAEQRRLADRLTFIHGEARAAGLTIEQLNGEASA